MLCKVLVDCGRYRSNFTGLIERVFDDGEMVVCEWEGVANHEARKMARWIEGLTRSGQPKPGKFGRIRVACRMETGLCALISAADMLLPWVFWAHGSHGFQGGTGPRLGSRCDVRFKSQRLGSKLSRCGRLILCYC